MRRRQRPDDRVFRALKGHERIVIYSDFDCDGVTSATIMYDALRAIGFQKRQLGFVIPDRLRHGYGLFADPLEDHVKELPPKTGKPTLLIAVDCGSATKSTDLRRILGSIESVLGMDLIIIDHHAVPAVPAPELSRPQVVHLNPKLWPGQSELQKMCAGGLTYLFAETLVSRARAQKRWKRNRALILAGLATCVDVVPLTGINRALLKHSVRLANQPKSLALVPGLAALKRRLGPTPGSGLPVTEETYGFYWGPCLNAAGRMADANYARKLLAAVHETGAMKWARKCIQMNSWRKATERAMVEEALPLAAAQIASHDPPIIIVSKPTWHPGVVGIVASRLKEVHRRPVIVASAHPGRDFATNPASICWRGSGRSVPGCDLGNLFHHAAAAAPPVIQSGGGHPMAGGLNFSEEQRPDLQDKLVRLSGFDHRTVSEPVEVLASASAFRPNEWASIFKRLRPFGNGNPCPALVVEAAELQGIRVRTRVDASPLLDQFVAARDGAEIQRITGISASQRRKGRRSHYWAFAAEDFNDPEALIERLQSATDRVSVYIRDRMDLASRRLLHERGVLKLSPAARSAELARTLDKLLSDRELYDATRFDKIILRPETKLLLKLNPSGRSLNQLNRLLLEDAYPKELARRRIERMPKVVAYEGLFQDVVTGDFFSARWPNLEEAEMLWQVHGFLDPSRTRQDCFQLPHLFRLQLQLGGFVSLQQWSNVYRGANFEHDYCFQIRQCIPRERAAVRDLRMLTKWDGSKVVRPPAAASGRDVDVTSTADNPIDHSPECVTT
jgi:single-stranded-DNA-specific exonuclease